VGGGDKDEGKIRNGVTEESLYEQADNFFAQGEYHRAEKLLERLIEASPGHADALSLLARVCANQGRLDGALRFIEEAISVAPMNPGRHYLHASILIEMGRKPEAMTALKKAIYIDTDFALAYFAMGNLALGSGNRVEAERDFKTALLLLGKYSYDDILLESEGMTAGRLMELIGSIQWRKTERRVTRDERREMKDAGR
jgi:chemotaxis protein methyltransferase CheR